MPITYAIGDIHGSLPQLETLIKACRSDAGGRPLRFVLLGDYIDRGPDSAGVMRFIIDQQSLLGDSVIALQGNHEAMMLDVLDGTAVLVNWLLSGGAATLQSYGVNHPSALPGPHLDWLRGLPLSYDDGRRFFVHAGIDPRQPRDAQRPHDLLWIREPFLSDRRDHGRLIVHGHTPLLDGKPDLRSNRLNVDTAAVFGGHLTAAVFDDTQTAPLSFLQA